MYSVTLLMLLTLMRTRDDHCPVRTSGGHVTVTSSISLNASAAERARAHTHQTVRSFFVQETLCHCRPAFSHRLLVQASTTSLPASDTGAKSLRRARCPFTRASWTATPPARSPFPRRRRREAGPRSAATRDRRACHGARPAQRQRSGRWMAVTFSRD